MYYYFLLVLFHPDHIHFLVCQSDELLHVDLTVLPAPDQRPHFFGRIALRIMEDIRRLYMHDWSDFFLEHTDFIRADQPEILLHLLDFTLPAGKQFFIFRAWRGCHALFQQSDFFFYLFDAFFRVRIFHGFSGVGKEQEAVFRPHRFQLNQLFLQ